MTADGARDVRAVVFDWGGTLTPWHTVDLAAQWRDFAAEYHVDEPHLRDDLAARIAAAEDAGWRRGRGDDHASARFEEILAEAGVVADDPRAVVAGAAYRRFWEPHTWTDPQVRPLWEALRDNGIRVGVLSNTIWSRDYHRGVFERDGVLDLLDADVYSSETPWVKPHPEIFRFAADRVGVAPEHCVYVGDRAYEDVHGPQAVGMRAIWVPHSDIPEGQQVAVDAVPDGVAHELLDVLDLVLGWRADAAPAADR
ncbi:HAD family hydrolase [Lapillicoccus jejuensis]|uniref:Putative hydrolase of the HAD superfamily n=1 Tax=Lapillicoccus jejuensis TaxID=402171 RepID=A0A542E3J8_9MICO|nr:HAD family hydrolase [Lapillicoccus jejuensis]TQJ09911.1 putative hydrolase of the HAD superfamily [Lapillicoccus jejuensis]